MPYVSSQAFAGRGSQLLYSTNPPSVPYVAVAELKMINFSGSKYDLSDVTNMESSNFKEWLPTLADSGDLAFSGNLIPNDVTEAAIIGFFNVATLVSWEVVLPPNVAQGYPTTLGTFSFLGFVVEIARTIPVEKEGSISGKIKITGKVSYATGS